MTQQGCIKCVYGARGEAQAELVAVLPGTLTEIDGVCLCVIETNTQDLHRGGFSMISIISSIALFEMLIIHWLQLRP